MTMEEGWSPEYGSLSDGRCEFGSVSAARRCREPGAIRCEDERQPVEYRPIWCVAHAENIRCRRHLHVSIESASDREARC